MELKKIDFSVVEEFEKAIADFFGAPNAVAVDSCTHGIELCLRLAKATHISCPKRTYLSIPTLASKLNISLLWKEKEEWQDYYNLYSHKQYKIYDAAVLWKKDSYIPDTFMCISFQYQKHLSLGRGGVILCQDYNDYYHLKKMVYDGRLPGIPWREQDIDMIGYHYYMTPETAKLGLEKLPKAIETVPRQWVYTDWPDLTQMTVFKNKREGPKPRDTEDPWIAEFGEDYEKVKKENKIFKQIIICLKKSIRMFAFERKNVSSRL